MKIRPSDRFLRKLAAESGEAILVVGSRKAESSNRLASIKKFEEKSVRKNFTPHINLSNVFSFLPIKNWTNDDVWLYLLQEECPWGIQNKDLLSMYKGATDGGECPLVIDTSTPSCGDSRFGCWVCTVVEQDKSIQGFIENGETWLEPMAVFRNMILKMREERGKHRVKDEKRIGGYGPFQMKSRKIILKELFKVEKLIFFKKSIKMKNWLSIARGLCFSMKYKFASSFKSS